MEQYDKKKIQFIFNSTTTGRNYFLKKHDRIVDEENHVLARIGEGTVTISRRLSPQERNDVLRCIGMVMVYQYYS